MDWNGDMTCPDGRTYTYQYRVEHEQSLAKQNIAPSPSVSSHTYNYIKSCAKCGHDNDEHGIIKSVCYSCPQQICQPSIGSSPPTSLQDPTTAKLTGVSSPELDKFLTAMLRSVGGALTIYPADGELVEGERLCVTRYENPERIVYELRTEDDDEGHVRDSNTG